MTLDYITVADIKVVMPDTTFGTSYDDLLAKIVTRASREFDRLTKRPTGAYAVGADSTRYFDGSGVRELWIGELAAAPTSVSVAEAGDVDDASGSGGDYTDWETSDYLLWPPNALAEGRPIIRLDIDQLNGSKAIWYAFPKSVKIVSLFGYSSSSNLPDDVVLATTIIATRLFKRGQQGFQDVSAVKDLAQLRYAKGVDPEVTEIIDYFKRTTI